MNIDTGHKVLIEKRIQELKKNYKGSIYNPVHYILSLPAKRIRPILTLIGSEMFGKISEETINVALAIELFHNFTLIHDDIMDQAPLRRGVKSVHCEWDVNQAILSGDAMMVLAYEHIFKAKNFKVFKEFNQVAEQVCIGQQKDMEFETSWEVEVAQYLDMIKLKTSVLLGCALQLGALVSGADESDQNKLREFGIELGLAFQIQDDFLDLFGKSTKVGKRSGGDVMAKKKTILILQTLKSCSNDEKEEILKFFESEITEDYLSRIKAIMINNKIPEKVDELKQHHMNTSENLLSQISGNESAKRELWNLALRMMDREF